MRESDKFLGKYFQRVIKYIETGRDGQTCSACEDYVVENAEKGEGCETVADVRHGDGWCLLWRLRRSHEDKEKIS